MDLDALRVADAIDPPKKWTLDELQEYVIKWAERKGWEFDGTSIPEKLCLIHSEISEALEEYRDGHPPHVTRHSLDNEGNAKPEGIPSEIADVAIRLLHFCGNFGFSLQDAILEKMAYNEKRPYRHGGKLA